VQPPLSAEQQKQIETLAERLLQLYDCSRPPVPIEQILARPPKELQGMDMSDLSLVFGIGEHRHEYRMAMARFLYRELCRSGRDGWAGVDLPYHNEAARYFAICVLAPRAWIVKSTRNPLTNLEKLSEEFQVPEYAMASRLAQMGKRVRGMQ